MEQLEELFDDCDEMHAGKVSVSILIAATKNEVLKSVQDPNMSERVALLQSVRDLLDPLHQDTLIDKATWIKAWRSQSDSDSCMDTSCDALDQSKQSYCFSPGSRSSSLESETEDLPTLKEEIKCLKNSLKLVKEQLQNQEDAVIQDQTERREMEKNDLCQKNQIMKLTKQLKHLQETNEDLQSSLDSYERENNNTVEQCHLIEKNLRGQIAAKQNEICLLSKEVEELNQTINVLKNAIDELKSELALKVKSHSEQIKEYQEAMKEADFKDEISAKITQSLLHNRDLAARLEESDFSGVDLQSELLEITHYLTPSLNVDMKRDAAHSSELHSVASSTPRVLHVKPAVATSLLQEMQALGPGIPRSSILDCSFDNQALSNHSASESDDSSCSSDDKRVPRCSQFPSIPSKGLVKFTKEDETSHNSCTPIKHVEKTSGLQEPLQNSLSNKATQTNFNEISFPPFLNNPGLSLVENETNFDEVEAFKTPQTDGLKKSSCEEMKATLSSWLGHATTTTAQQLVQNEVDTPTTYPSVCNMETQTTHPSVCNIETQTTYPSVCNMETQTTNTEIWRDTVPKCGIKTQSSPSINFDKETILKSDFDDLAIYSPVCKMDAQAQVSNKIIQNNILEESVVQNGNVTLNLSVCNMETQTTHLPKYDVETQTTHSDIQRETISKCGLKTQTSSSINFDKETIPDLAIYSPVCEMGAQSQVSNEIIQNNIFQESVVQNGNVNLKNVKTGILEASSTMYWSSHRIGKWLPESCRPKRRRISNTFVECNTRTPSEEPAPLPTGTFMQQQNSSFKSSLNSTEEQKTTKMDIRDDLAHSAETKTNNKPSSEMGLFKPRLKPWLAVICLLCLFFILLICSTVVLSVGILETMSQSGMSSGSAPRWISHFTYLVKPFLRVEYRTREPTV